MKHAKKLVSLLLTLIMVLSMSVAAFAAQSSSNTITINNAKAGETYSAYKMLELVVDNTADPKKYVYTVAPEWADFFDDSNKTVWGTVLVKDTQGHFTAVEGVSSETAWSATSALSAFAEAAAKYVKDKNLSTTITAEGQTGENEKTTAVLNTTESGYYLVTSTLGTRAMIDTTPGDVAIDEKNSEDTIEKQVKEGNNYVGKNDAQVGDTVEFKSVATIAPRSVNVKIHDTMDSGLTLNTDSIELFTDAALTSKYTGATIKTGANADEGDTFTIEIPDTFAAEVTENQTLYIVYTAEINAAAVKKDSNGVAIVNQNNKTEITFGDASSVESSTTTTTHKFTVHKYATENQTTNLANAIFQVKKNGTVVNLVKLDDKNYRVVDDTETGDAASHVKANQEVETIAAGTIVSDFVTVGDGDIVIWGVDSGDSYAIEEIQAPKGYNKINPASQTVNVSTDNSTTVEVANNTGSELPSTGGIGTTIFYVVGSILLVGAAILLITKRRMKAE